MSTFEIRMFPRLSILRDGQSLERHIPAKAGELLCFLLLHRDQPHHRETLASLLWIDSGEAQSRRNLRKSLWQLQSALNGKTETNARHLIFAEDSWIGLDEEADVWIDAVVLEKAYLHSRGVLGLDLSQAESHSLRTATDLYHGDLLEGWYQDWCVLARERYLAMYLILLDKLMQYYEMVGDYETGLTCGERALLHDRAHERTHRRLMRLYYMSGDRTGALRQFNRCVAALDEELAVGPSQRTVELRRQIQDETLVSLRTEPKSDRH